MSRLARYLTADAPAFALLHRPGATGPEVVELVTGDLVKAAVIADLPVPAPDPSGRGHTTTCSPSSRTGRSPSAASP